MNINVTYNWMIFAFFTFVLAMLKIGGVIEWGWIWIFCPLWGSALLFIIISIIAWLIWKRKK